LVPAHPSSSPSRTSDNGSEALSPRLEQWRRPHTPQKPRAFPSPTNSLIHVQSDFRGDCCRSAAGTLPRFPQEAGQVRGTVLALLCLLSIGVIGRMRGAMQQPPRQQTPGTSRNPTPGKNDVASHDQRNVWIADTLVVVKPDRH